jgi:hypothetical protein
MYRSVLVFGAYLAVASCAVYAQDRPDFSGTWQLKDDSQQKVVIKQSGETIQIIRPGADAAHKTDVNCSFYGTECKATINGEQAKSSFYYNGATLVQFAYMGKDGKQVIRTRRDMSDDGKQMTVEVMQMAPSPDSPKKLVYVRAEPEGTQTATTTGPAASGASPQK